VDLVRLHGINAPELRETGGIEARERLRGLVNGRMVRLDGGKRDKYGRLLGVIWLGTTNICNLLVSEGLAVHWDGAGEKPSLK
jgi:micrococcal nuclease